MRLTCPNCGAQYEVDESAVPEGGRDVQCSNCGHTWFQRAAGKPDTDDVETADAPDEATRDDLTETEDEADQVEPEIAASDDSETADEDDDSASDEDDSWGEEDAPEPDTKSARPRELDSGVTGILREEAERETTERAAEAGSLETQTDMGLEEGDDGSAVQDRMARLRGLDDEEVGLGAENLAALAAGAARKDLLPDIEEINSTLTASTDRRDGIDGEDAQERKQSRGFRLGFGLMLILFAVLALVYSYAPRIVDSYPTAAPWLNTYVDLVNQLRVTVDGTMQWAVEKLTGLLAQLTGESKGT